jgi:hypothetical protein
LLLASTVTTEKFNHSTTELQFTTQPLDLFAVTASWKRERNVIWEIATMMVPPAELTAPSQDVVMVFSTLKSNAIMVLPTDQLDLATNFASGLLHVLLPHVTKDPAAHHVLELVTNQPPVAMVDPMMLL